VKDLLRHGIYLRSLPTAGLPTNYSPAAGIRTRAAQLQAFLGGLQACASCSLASPGLLKLLVVNRADWRALTSYPYGFPVLRTRRAVTSMIAAADYPSRMLRSFDDILLFSGQTGRYPPGRVPEFLDLLIGQRWGYAFLGLLGVRTRIRWFDEILATHLFRLSLRDYAGHSYWRRCLAWSRVFTAERGDYPPPWTFVPPKSRTDIVAAVRLHGMLIWGVSVLLDHRGWELFGEVERVLATRKQVGLEDTLVALEPGFAELLESLS